LDLPDMGARTLIESLRQVAPGLAVILIADNPAVSEAVTAMKTGAHAVIDSRLLSTGLLLHIAPLLRGR
jgi:DNA-binding NtrC family response regulator